MAKIPGENSQRSASKVEEEFVCQFFIDKPLVSDDKTYGSKHFRYFLDDKLVAVGVCDVLPTALSSVYFYHDPDLMKLELGKLSGFTKSILSPRIATRQSIPWVISNTTTWVITFTIAKRCVIKASINRAS